MIVFRPTDLPCPVAPATRRCGVSVRSAMYMSEIVDETEMEENKERIIATLKNYKIAISHIEAVVIGRGLRH